MISNILIFGCFFIYYAILFYSAVNNIAFIIPKAGWKRLTLRKTNVSYGEFI